MTDSIATEIDPDTYCRQHGTPRSTCDESHPPADPLQGYLLDEIVVGPSGQTLAQAAADEALSAQTDALEAHIQATLPANREAFRGPVVRNYRQGDCVWLHDHYNTGVVNGPVGSADHWSVTTSNADGTTHHYEYPADQLRPATSPVEFRWGAAVR